ncbi:MAG TPA: 30S ribosomal protein S16 [Chloroflexota bacterium]|nr:30S ribosomal protein S16 [Chloroflexota bacterium]
MSVKIRLRRMGAKHQPSYRIVIADSRSPRDGRYIDQVGFYNPLTNPAIINVDKDKAIDWLRRGAEPTDTVAKLFTKFDIDPAVVRKPDYVAPTVESSTPAAAATRAAGDTSPTE